MSSGERMAEVTMVETVTLRPSTPGFSDGDAVIFGVMSMLAEPPPRMLLAAHVGGTDLRPVWLSLGDTAEFGGTTWRFEDVHFASPDRWVATVRSVPPGSPPFTPPPLTGDRVWNEVELRPSGPVDEAAIVAMEERLGLELPPTYRRWLAETNGVTPVQTVHVPGYQFQLSPWQPLLGIRPDEPHYDLSVGLHRAPDWLTRDHVVIAIATGGLLAVRATLPGSDEIVFLSEITPDPVPVELVPVAPGIHSFCAYLQPAPPVRPARLGTIEPPPAPGPVAEPSLVDLVGDVLDFANEARARMCVEFDVRYIAEVAMQARAGRIDRRGQCADGLRYDIHGNGYDVFTADGMALTLQATGYAHVDRKAGPDDGLADLIDLYAAQSFIDDQTGTRFGLDALTAAFDEHVRRGAARSLGDLRYELPPVPGGVEEQQ
jgi:hypothetical protein